MIFEVYSATIPAERPKILIPTGANIELVDEIAVFSRHFNDVFLPGELDVLGSSVVLPVQIRVAVAVCELDGIKQSGVANNTSIVATGNTNPGDGYSSSRAVTEWVTGRSSRWATFEQ
jgi:hypothetical protein